MSSTNLLECKKLIVKRCLNAIILSFCLQLFSLFIFLIYMNLKILQPLESFKQTISDIFSFSMWLTLMLLMIAQFIYGVFIGKFLIAVKHYYATRFMRFWRSFLQKTILLGINMTIGFLTSLLYANFLYNYYSAWDNKLTNGDRLNTFYVFLIGAGISAGIYHFFKYSSELALDIEFPIIQQKLITKLRSLVYTTIKQFASKSIKPVICYAFVYWLLNDYFLHELASWLSVSQVNDDTSISLFNIMTNFRILLFAWILTAIILSNCHLMQHLLSIFLCEEITFAIERQTALTNDGSVILLADALSMNKLPVIQMLAAFNLYNISTSITSGARQQIFSLSVPGGHAYNWNQLSTQCLVLLNVFIDDLTEATKCFDPLVPLTQFATNNPAETAEKILLRQYNDIYGIRRMVKDPINASTDKAAIICTSQKTTASKNLNFENIYKRFQMLLNSFYRSIPGLQYMFGEIDGGRIVYLLTKSEMIAWVVQGIAGLYAISLAEDKYGVVQVDMAQTIKAILKLKYELDKLYKVRINDDIVQQNIHNLMNAVKRSTYKITSVFGEYLEDIIEDSQDLRVLTCFKNYRIA